MPSPRSVPHDISDALQAWQETADESWLEHVISETRHRLEDAARGVLRRLSIRDWSAVDDAVALVFDHLRRLPATAPSERGVTRFMAERSRKHGSGDAGLAYLVWLARERALDVARQRCRQAKRRRLLAATRHAPLVDHAGLDASIDAAEAADDAAARLHAALDMLEPRLCLVIRLLLDGKSQAVIAHALGVCEGTVSRLRTRAIAELKRLLA